MKYRMILIDPEKRTITELEAEFNRASMKKMISAEIVEAFHLAEHHDRWDVGLIDEEGLVRGEPIHALHFVGWKNPIAGKCLVYGASKKNGEACDAGFPLDHLERVIVWLGLISPEVKWVTKGNVTSAEIIWVEV